MRGGGSTGAAPEDAQETTGSFPEPGDVNPVVPDDFPDPDVLKVDGVFHAYATEGNLSDVRVARSEDLLEWEPLDDALPELPSWVIPGRTWASEVTEIAPGQYALYCTATSSGPRSSASAWPPGRHPRGHSPSSARGCRSARRVEGGAIDASTFLDADGTRYLLRKDDGNTCGFDTWLYIARWYPTASRSPVRRRA